MTFFECIAFFLLIFFKSFFFAERDYSHNLRCNVCTSVDKPTKSIFHFLIKCRHINVAATTLSQAYLMLNPCCDRKFIHCTERRLLNVNVNPLKLLRQLKLFQKRQCLSMAFASFAKRYGSLKPISYRWSDGMTDFIERKTMNPDFDGLIMMRPLFMCSLKCLNLCYSG